jgi:hypothetical protein
MEAVLLIESEGGHYRFEDPAQQQALAKLMTVLPERVDLWRSPQWSHRRATEALNWCYANLDRGALDYGEHERIDQGGRTLHRRKRSWNPHGSFILMRRTFLFRHVTDAVWFKMVWW